MEKILIYKIPMHLLGRITQLPDSQKIFGALIYAYAKEYSNEQATDLVRKIQNDEVYFTLSNLLPAEYFPVPHGEIIERLPKMEDDKNKKIYKAIKKRQFLKADKIKLLLANGEKVERCYPYIVGSLSQESHNSIDSVRYDMLGQDPNIYSVPETTFIEVDGEQDNVRREVYKQFEFYLAMEKCEEQEKILNLLKKIHREEDLFIRGARASQGLNLFTIEAEPKRESWGYEEKYDEYLNLGMLLPNKINFLKSSLKIFTSERRPYQKENDWNENMDRRQFISFIEAGSIVYSDNLEQVGKSTVSPFDERAIVFGNAFLYPVPMLKGGVHHV